MAPPTIAPRSIGSCWEEVGIVLDIEDSSEELISELELDASVGDVATAVAVGCEVGLVKELLDTEVELDGVAVASTAFGTGSRLSVRASDPQAMYSKD